MPVNTKRATVMQHLRKSEKNKDHEILSKAIVRASNNTVIPHAEESGQKFLIRYFTENSAVEEILKHQGGEFKCGKLADYVRRETSEQEVYYADINHKSGVKIVIGYYTTPKNVMHEVPKMSVENSHAISRRMFARTAEDMAQELYDDAE